VQKVSHLSHFDPDRGASGGMIEGSSKDVVIVSLGVLRYRVGAQASETDREAYMLGFFEAVKDNPR